MIEKINLKMTVNKKNISIFIEPHKRLLDVIRDELRLTGTKEGCGVGECGACTVIVDGEVVNSCMTLAASMEGKSILTIEGLGEGGDLDPVQEAFIDHTALQCGFCTPGLVLSGKCILDRNPNASREEIIEGISGNLCRCTGYEQVIDAIESARDYINNKR